MNFRDHDRQNTICRSLLLAAALLAACRGPDAGSGRGGTGTANQAIQDDDQLEPRGRAIPRAGRSPSAGHRLAAAAVGVPPPIPGSTQFDITGFLQEAHSAGPNAGGTLTVNGQTVIVPASTIVILPASALTWDELFTQAPDPYGPTQTGLAMFDTPVPLTTSEVHVIGNRVMTGGVDRTIAGLIYVAQQSLNAGAGFINFIDYDAGELRIGGTLGDATTGTRVRINDPVIADLGTGRYSKGLSPDRRFTVDQDNPTIMSATGYPMCLPRVAPPGPNQPETDPLCPQGNRPLDATGTLQIKFTMPDPATLDPGQLPDPRVQAPLEVGDYVAFSGILVTDNTEPTTGPWPGLASTYVSAYSIVDNTAIYTAPGTDPAYIQIEVTIIGTGGLNVAGVGEATARTRFEGMSTDLNRGIHLYAIDLDPATGAGTDRDLGTMIKVDTAAVPGRWRFVPPCDPFGSIPAKPDKTCVMNQAGTFLPPTREVRAVVEGLQSQVPGLSTAHTTANGLFFGQYHAPVLEYLFPENVPGTSIVPNNFEAIPFLACGGFTSSAGTLAGQLDPWPGLTAPSCANTPAPPVASAGPDQTVASGASVTLAGSATGSAPLSFAWTQTAGPTVALSDPTVAAPAFVAPQVTATTVLAFQLTVTNAAGTSTATVNVTVGAATAPTVNHIPARTVGSGTPVSMTATCSDPRGLPCSFVWTQTAGTPVVLTPNPSPGATVAFTVALAAGAPPTTLTLQIVATNTAGDSSPPDVTTVTVTPPADVVAITNVEYRIAKQRLIMTATSSVIDPSITLTLQPYVTAQGTVFDPATIGNTFTNTGGGIHSITIVGAPQPASPPATPLTVRSSAGGVSPPHGIDRLRQ